MHIGRQKYKERRFGAHYMVPLLFSIILIILTIYYKIREYKLQL